MQIGNVICGLRSYDRGSLFTPYLNLADEQNQTGATWTINAAPGVTMVDDVTATTGRITNWATAGAVARTWLGYFTLNSALSSHYLGEYRCFLRMKNLVGALAWSRLWLMIGTYTYLNYQWESTPKTPNVVTYYDYIDFGKITLPPMPHDTGETYDSMVLRIDGEALGAIHNRLQELILIPCDECIYETYNIPVAGIQIQEAQLGYQTNVRRLEVSSSIPRRMMTTELENGTSGTSIIGWAHRNNGPSILQPNERQRWWFLNKGTYGGDSIRSRSEAVTSVQGWKVSRYLSMRGAR